MTNVEKSLRSLGFEDGTIQVVRIESHEILLRFANWQERLFDLRFSKVEFFKVSSFGSHISEMRVTSEREIILATLMSIDLGYGVGNFFAELPHVYQIDILEDEVVFTAVFEELSITSIE